MIMMAPDDLVAVVRPVPCRGGSLASAAAGDRMKSSIARAAAGCVEAVHTPAGERGDDLDARRHRSADHVEAFQVHQFAELLEAEVDLAARHQRAHRHARRRLHDARSAISSAMPQRSNSLASAHAARTGGVADACAPRARRALSASSVPTSGRAAPVAHRDRHRSSARGRSGCRDDVARRDQLVDRIGGEHDASNGSPACTRLAASTPPTDSISTSLPALLGMRRPARPAIGVWPSTKCRQSQCCGRRRAAGAAQRALRNSLSGRAIQQCDDYTSC